MLDGLEVLTNHGVFADIKGGTTVGVTQQAGHEFIDLPLGGDLMAMNDPVHPGAIVREDCLKPLGLSVTEGARRLGIGRQTLSNLVNEKASVSIEMAYRLSKAFGSTPETWLAMQLAFDLARSRHLEQKIKVGRIAAA